MKIFTYFTLFALSSGALMGNITDENGNGVGEARERKSSIHEEKKASESSRLPSAKFLRGKTMIFDFSQSVIIPDKGSTKEKPQLLNSKIHIVKLKRESWDDDSYFGRLGKQSFLRCEPGKMGPFPKADAYITYVEGSGELTLACDDIPDRWGGTNDCCSFCLELKLSFIDETHFSASGTIEINYNRRYTGTIKDVKITLLKNNKKR